MSGISSWRGHATRWTIFLRPWGYISSDRRLRVAPILYPPNGPCSSHARSMIGRKAMPHIEQAFVEQLYNLLADLYFYVDTGSELDWHLKEETGVWKAKQDFWSPYSGVWNVLTRQCNQARLSANVHCYRRFRYPDFLGPWPGFGWAEAD